MAEPKTTAEYVRSLRKNQANNNQNTPKFNNRKVKTPEIILSEDDNQTNEKEAINKRNKHEFGAFDSTVIDEKSKLSKNNVKKTRDSKIERYKQEFRQQREMERREHEAKMNEKIKIKQIETIDDTSDNIFSCCFSKNRKEDHFQTERKSSEVPKPPSKFANFSVEDDKESDNNIINNNNIKHRNINSKYDENDKDFYKFGHLSSNLDGTKRNNNPNATYDPGYQSTFPVDKSSETKNNYNSPQAVHKYQSKHNSQDNKRSKMKNELSDRNENAEIIADNQTMLKYQEDEVERRRRREAKAKRKLRQEDEMKREETKTKQINVLIKHNHKVKNK